jgi:cellobiose-specific phosphotransferase system component IIA
MEKNWVKLMVGTRPHQIEIVKQMLEAHDLHVVLLNKQDSSYQFGLLELYVHTEDEAAARLLLAVNNLSEEEEEAQ